MLKIITSLALFLIGLAAQAQTAELANVTKIHVKNGVELVYTENATPMLQVETLNPKNVSTVVKGNTLTISAKKEKAVKVFVSTPKIESFKASSDSKITIDGPLTTDNLQIILNSGAQFSGLTRTETLKLYANYGTVYNGRSETKNFYGNFFNAKVNLSGTALFSKMTADEHTYVYAKNFVSDYSKVNAESNSSVVLHGKKDLRFITDASANVTYYGCPENVEHNNRPVASN